ncbi:MAG: hypothetical protein M3Z25_22455 [Actinomycetota bacterium]|nr:hypothetical protein [Pseudonocardiales bacterium]MDQ2710209.1 hypothetical protein [Actinomycetota bacterium]
MRVINPDTSSEGEEGCDRLFDDGGDDVLIQLRPASAADHEAIKPNYVPGHEIFGRVSKAAFLEAARTLGLS